MQQIVPGEIIFLLILRGRVIAQFGSLSEDGEDPKDELTFTCLVEIRKDAANMRIQVAKN